MRVVDLTPVEPHGCQSERVMFSQVKASVTPYQFAACMRVRVMQGGAESMLATHQSIPSSLHAGQGICLHRLHTCGKLRREHFGHQPPAYARCNSGACSADCARARIHPHILTKMEICRSQNNRPGWPYQRTDRLGTALESRSMSRMALQLLPGTLTIVPEGASLSGSTCWSSRRLGRLSTLHHP